MRGREKYRQRGYPNLKERYFFPLPAAWVLQSLHQTKLPNVGSTSLPPAKAEDVEFNQ